jgi:hypothetical protein
MITGYIVQPWSQVVADDDAYVGHSDSILQPEVPQALRLQAILMGTSLRFDLLQGGLCQTASEGRPNKAEVRHPLLCFCDWTLDRGHSSHFDVFNRSFERSQEGSLYCTHVSSIFY